MVDGSKGIKIDQNGGFSCRFRVKTNGKETPQSGTKLLGQQAIWQYDELINLGFHEGDNCWVSVDIDAGRTNHESGGNFILSGSAQMLTYELSGGK
ncbi:hypothetical protein AbraCBS73388_001231 [Aspergillus brasiliensis]|uniref:Uncharacterized protein n=1 Tax=Aspergillus brasiliensis TaxID=319629 RepID=A0A9W5YXI4_9EURO|nr:hypothetical protein AbraCBS73388_001231 [Aspergillus brasiliensis]